MSKYNVHAGHNYNAPGAGGRFSETSEARKVKDQVINKLRSLGHTVYDCTDETGGTSNANLANIVANCNAHGVDLDVSIHFNAFNSSAHGTEVFCYDSGTHGVAGAICNNIAALGFTNRGIKGGTGLYVLKNTNSQAILIECCFCDSPTDAAIYNLNNMATAIVKSITGKTVSDGGGTSTPAPAPVGNIYRIRKTWADVKGQVGAYKNLESAKAECPKGYNVYDNNGKAVYSNAAAPAPDVNSNIYRIRKTWADANSQIGAYKNLESAKAECKPGYTVYDWNGKAVHANPVPPVAPPPSTDKVYRIRKTWADVKGQVGAYKNLESAKAECPKGYNVYDWNGTLVYSNPGTSAPNPTPPEEKPTPPAPKPENVSPIKGVSQEVFIAYIGPLAKKDMKKTGVLASVTVAQSILESSWGQSDLSLNANNLFGMKASLSGNTWDSEWDGKIYAKRSPEDDGNGNITQVLSDFRAYDEIYKSIKDHSDYLNGAKNGSELRYAGLKGEKDYRTAIQIIKAGGYATDSKYIDKICDIIEEYDLTVFDYEGDPVDYNDLKNDMNEVKGILKTIMDIVTKILGFFTSK